MEETKERLTKEQKFSPHRLRKIEWVMSYPRENNNALIGIAALADYQPVHKRAELLIGVNQRKNSVDNFGAEAALLILEFAFNVVKLNKVISIVYGYNEAAQNNAVHLGFTQEGLLRNHYYNEKTKQYIDLYQNGLLSTDFHQSRAIARWSKRLLGRDITESEPSEWVKATVRRLDKSEAEAQLFKLRRDN